MKVKRNLLIKVLFGAFTFAALFGCGSPFMRDIFGPKPGGIIDSIPIDPNPNPDPDPNPNPNPNPNPDPNPDPNPNPNPNQDPDPDPNPVEDPYTGPPGTGTSADPFIVHDVQTLKKVGTGTDGWTMSACYRQVRNIDLSNEGNWTPIGTSSAPFIGSYNGSDFGGSIKTISALTIINSTVEYLGMFGYLNLGAELIKIKLVNVNIKNNTADFTGGLVGCISSAARIENCNVSGSIIGSSNNIGGIAGKNYSSSCRIKACVFSGVIIGGAKTGGIVGENLGIVENCTVSTTADLTGTLYVGGIAAWSNGPINNCIFNGNIKSNSDNTGGIVGYNSGGMVKGCIAGGNVSADGINTGGVAGLNTGEVINCSATGSVSGNSNIGGVVGYNDSNPGAVVTDCFSTGNVTGLGDYVGGIAGFSGYQVQKCYAAGTVKGKDYVGGICGNSNGLVANCVALNPKIIINVSGTNAGRVVGNSSGSLNTNFAWDQMIMNGSIITIPGIDSIEGANVFNYGPSSDNFINMDFWRNTAGWDVGGVWYWEEGFMPYLDVNEIPAWPPHLQ